MQELGIHLIQTIHHLVSSYQQNIEQGLISLPPVNEKQNLEAFMQQNKQLEQTLKEANLTLCSYSQDVYINKFPYLSPVLYAFL